MPRHVPGNLSAEPFGTGTSRASGGVGPVARTVPGSQMFTAGAVFSYPELQAMAMDGLLRRVYGKSYLMTGTAESPALRALSALNALPPTLRDRATLGRGTAAWVLDCAGAPDKLSILTDRRRRTSALRPFSDAVMHEVALGPLDVVTIGGVRVTTPMRTAMDIALHGNDATCGETLRRLGLHPQLGCSLKRVSLMLETVSRAPGKSRALARLREATKQVEQAKAADDDHQ
ncbi:hypothetical protein [Arthrobacter roseus]|uniref:hypothetical protein n=1 Tax=Arthrobacter roseus TaxID=136274 RepID=UPI001965DB27|nr:hypothetical protein [Arthrobacter roseus]MBM7848658.1 hypothetical protein [Arthrobacter roseus]